MSLLSQALKVPSNQARANHITDEHIELAVAWLEDRVSGKQVAKVLGDKAGGGSLLQAGNLRARGVPQGSR